MLDRFHHGRDSILFFLEQTLTLDVCLPFLLSVYQPKLPSGFAQHHGIVHRIASQGTQFMPSTPPPPKKVWYWAHTYGIHGSCQVPKPS